MGDKKILSEWPGNKFNQQINLAEHKQFFSQRIKLYATRKEIN